MADMLLVISDRVPFAALVPFPVQLLGGLAELHDQIVGEILKFKLPALFPPQPNQIGLDIVFSLLRRGRRDCRPHPWRVESPGRKSCTGSATGAERTMCRRGKSATS
jgi:hypothetical protein